MAGVFLAPPQILELGANRDGEPFVKGLGGGFLQCFSCEKSPDTPWDWHICRSVGGGLVGQWGGISMPVPWSVWDHCLS